MSGKFHEGVRIPTRIGEELFNEKQKASRLRKIASGAHHTLALTTDGKIYAWGDPESGKLGRMLNTRNKDKQALMIERVASRDAQDVWAGNHHSFYINKAKEVYAWGLNNHGQLGVGHKDNISLPQKVKNLEGVHVIMMAGGEHHTIAVSEDGRVFCWGRNDEGQCGSGDLFGQYKRRKAQEEYQRMIKEEEEKQKKLEEDKKMEEEKKASNQEEEKKEGGEAAGAVVEMIDTETKPSAEGAVQTQPGMTQGTAARKRKTAAKTKEEKFAEKEKEEDLNGIGYFHSP